MKILYYISGYDGCGYYRVQMIAKYLNKIPDVFAKISSVYSNEEINWADVIVLQKQSNQKALGFIEYAISIGKKVVTEVDDDYFNIPIWNPAYKPYLGKEQDLINFYLKSHAITVTTDHLANQLSKFSKTYALPNSLDFKNLDRFEDMPEEELGKYTKYLDCDQKRLTKEYLEEFLKDKVVVGWGGSPTHLKDLEQATPALIQLCAENKNIIIMMIGCTTQMILNTMMKNYSNQLILVEPIPIFGYQQALRSLPWDIGICPIEDNVFNRSKSNLKFLEFSTNGFACVCSNVENYTKTVQNGITGMLVDNSQTAWYTALKYLVDNKEERLRIAENGKKFVRENYDIAKNVNLWHQAYTEILNK